MILPHWNSFLRFTSCLFCTRCMCADISVQYLLRLPQKYFLLVSDPKDDITIASVVKGKEVVVPQGKVINTKFSSSSFWQSEYLIYKESQNTIRYLLKLTF